VRLESEREKLSVQLGDARGQVRDLRQAAKEQVKEPVSQSPLSSLVSLACQYHEGSGSSCTAAPNHSVCVISGDRHIRRQAVLRRSDHWNQNGE
jgi:hypothetical protein